MHVCVCVCVDRDRVVTCVIPFLGSIRQREFTLINYLGLTLPHSSPPSLSQASYCALHGRITHANSATGLGKLLGTILRVKG